MAMNFRISPADSDELGTVVKYLSAFGVPEENFAVDLTIARGLDYYTGTVYEMMSPALSASPSMA